ncbi:MAG: YbaN family protein [Planctomycetota bacterium]|nr:YbaN family protein [Planctomycetota bacterium]
MVDPLGPNGSQPPAESHGPLRWLLVSLGSLLTGLAALGAFLPVLPTTPFLLLAGACFARSSPSFHRRLKRAPIFGAYVEQWERDRSIPSRAKRKAFGLIALTFGYSIWAVEAAGLRALLAVLGLALTAFLASRPTTAEPRASDPGSLPQRDPAEADGDPEADEAARD